VYDNAVLVDVLIDCGMVVPIWKITAKVANI
jgi:hypothetical protein